MMKRTTFWRYINTEVGFDIFDKDQKRIATLEKSGKEDYKFYQGGKQTGFIDKQWGGMMELISTSDNYELIIEDSVPANDDSRILMLASVFIVDIRYNN